MGNLVFQATLGGQVNLVGPNTASTYNINVPTVNGNMVTTGDTGTVTNTMCATSVYTAPGTIGSGTPNTGAFTTLTTTSTINGLTVGKGAGAVSTNTAVGASALAGSGAYNVAVGYQALDANTTGNTLVAVGHNSLGANTSGAENTAVGQGSLQSNTTGSNNTAVGVAALSSNTSGGYNSALGEFSLYSNTTASQNTAVGYQAGYSNTTGSANTSLGYQAGYSITTGLNNIAFGANAMSNSAAVTGNANFGAGTAALYTLTTGSFNVAIGNAYGAGTAVLAANTTGSYNIAVGSGALGSNTTGSEHTAVGYQALYTNTTGVYSTAVGTQALYASNGNSNTGVGYGAGSLITSGAKNTILGRYNGNQGGLDIRTSSNYIVLSDGDGNPRGVFDNNGYFQVVATGLNLGGGTTPSIWRNYGTVGAGMHLSDNSILPTSKTGSISDNTVTWGSASYRWSVIYAANGSINTSDQNEKQDIQDLSAAELAVAQEIKGLFKTFRWKDAVAKKGDAARINVGVIAQDVQAAFANHGLDASRYALWCSDTWYEVDGIGVNSETGMPYTADDVGAIQRTRLGVRYDQLLAFVIAAM